MLVGKGGVVGKVERRNMCAEKGGFGCGKRQKKLCLGAVVGGGFL